MLRRLSLVAAGLVFVSFAFAPQSRAAVFDNPMPAGTYCIALDSFERLNRSDGEDERTYSKASVEIENLCGRAMEVSVCFVFARENGAGQTKACQILITRPMSHATVTQDRIEGLIAAPEISWRYYAPVF